MDFGYEMICHPKKNNVYKCVFMRSHSQTWPSFPLLCWMFQDMKKKTTPEAPAKEALELKGHPSANHPDHPYPAGRAPVPVNIRDVSTTSIVLQSLWGQISGWENKYLPLNVFVLIFRTLIAGVAIMIPDSVLVDLVVAFSDTYPAAPSSAQLNSGNLHLGLPQPHLWTATREKGFSTTFNRGGKKLQATQRFSLHNFYHEKGGPSCARCHSASCHSNVKLISSSRG